MCTCLISSKVWTKYVWIERFWKMNNSINKYFSILYVNLLRLGIRILRARPADWQPIQFVQVGFYTCKSNRFQQKFCLLDYKLPDMRWFHLNIRYITSDVVVEISSLMCTCLICPNNEIILNWIKILIINGKKNKKALNSIYKFVKIWGKTFWIPSCWLTYLLLLLQLQVLF